MTAVFKPGSWTAHQAVRSWRSIASTGLIAVWQILVNNKLKSTLLLLVARVVIQGCRKVLARKGAGSKAHIGWKEAFVPTPTEFHGHRNSVMSTLYGRLMSPSLSKGVWWSSFSRRFVFQFYKQKWPACNHPIAFAPSVRKVDLFALPA